MKKWRAHAGSGAWRRHSPVIVVLLALAAGLIALPQPASAVRWDSTPTNVHVKGMLQVSDGTYLADTTHIGAAEIGDSCIVNAGAKLGKYGSFWINADSTVTITGTTTVSATTSFGKAGSLLINADSTVTVDGAATFGGTVTVSSSDVTTELLNLALTVVDEDTVGQGGDGLDTLTTGLSGITVGNYAAFATARDTLGYVRAWVGANGDTLFVEFPWVDPHGIAWEVKPKTQ